MPKEIDVYIIDTYFLPTFFLDINNPKGSVFVCGTAFVILKNIIAYSVFSLLLF